MKSTKLAIVIPAYKCDFLEESLSSIKAQTNKDFTLYIGDDCSPFNIYDIVSRYESSLDIVYRRFEDNLGGHDLVAQWERCIAMSRKEEYIWLFSDDDVMDSNCVEEFYKSLEQTKNLYNLYHFDVNIIGEDSKLIRKCPSFEEVESAWSYYKTKVASNYRSFVVEYIFKRDAYVRCGGFVNFDLAWGSDKATWTLMSEDTGMYTIPTARVNWRRSSKNISPNKTSAIFERKMIANCDFLNWAFMHFKDSHPDVFDLNRKRLVRSLGLAKGKIGKDCFDDVVNLFFSVHGHHECSTKTRIGILCFHYRNFFFSSKIGQFIKKLI